MIIKSLARKRPGFRQLIGYIGRDNGPVFSRNLYGAEYAAEVTQAFETNHALLPKRKKRQCALSRGDCASTATGLEQHQTGRDPEATGRELLSATRA